MSERADWTTEVSALSATRRYTGAPEGKPEKLLLQAPRRSRSPGARDAGGGGGERKRGEFGGEGGPRKTGVCVAWNHKGFGFIRPDDGQGDDLFCHATQIRDGSMRRPRYASPLLG